MLSYFIQRTYDRKWLYVIAAILIILTPQIMACEKHQQAQANSIINELYHDMDPNSDMVKRLDTISAGFLGRKYVRGALGEGITARFDQAPRYRLDAFDCDTYVTTVLALALANNLAQFRQCLAKIRYKDGHISYISRNHFTSVDWNLNNQHLGFVRDITASFKNQDKQAVAKVSTTLIDKPSWYQHLTKQAIRLISKDAKEQNSRLLELKKRGSKLPALTSNLAYIPLSALFDSQGRANEYLFQQIPPAAIVEIVRPDWPIKQKIGTNLDISHLGFVFWHNKTLMFREASSVEGKVVDVSLIEYLRSKLTSPTIKGINVQIVVPQHAHGC